ncbi:MAG: MBL fold metallo-hydrolase [Deltaproteobacteria bacterium]|nr:MBL fold metallo-hydrolase [Deltaproteobacteria bacterium]
MKTATELWSDGTRRWLVVARDPERTDHLIDTNEYAMATATEVLITDPGGFEIFPAVFAAMTTAVDAQRIAHIFASHQDPDVISSLALWLRFNPRITCHLSWLWESFVPHFGGDATTFRALPDEGAAIVVGGTPLVAVPAHYLHSSGNFHLYDPAARLLFSGDVGAALLPEGAGLFVDDFDRHIRHAEGFHRRWMGSNEARRDWCERAAAMPIDLLCPQHGAIYRGQDVGRFINWFGELDVGLGHLRRAARAA